MFHMKWGKVIDTGEGRPVVVTMITIMMKLESIMKTISSMIMIASHMQMKMSKKINIYMFIL